MLNGNWIGFSTDPYQMVKDLKFARSAGYLPY